MMKESVRSFIMCLAIALSIAVLITILSAFPPLSILRGWLEHNGLSFIWTGVVAGIIALCLSLFRSKR